MPKYSYLEASRRHFKDAEILENESRYANASQLLGISAECGLKAAFCGFGLLPQTPDGEIPLKQYKIHIDKLITAVSLMSTNMKSAQYQTSIPSIACITHWGVDQRYISDIEYSTNLHAHFPSWKHSAEEIQRMLDTAIMNGDIP